MAKGGKASYRIVIPIDDEYEAVSAAAHQVLTQTIKGVVDPHVTGPHQQGHKRVKHLCWIGLDNPQSDSSAKQLAVHIAEVANVEAIHVIKEGKSGIADWVMRNKNFSFNKKDPH